jgi:hypothetical protein
VRVVTNDIPLHTPPGIAEMNDIPLHTPPGIAEMNDLPLHTLPGIAEMNDLPLHTLPGIAEMNDLPLHTLPGIAEMNKASLFVAMPRAFAAAPAPTDPARDSPYPPARHLHVVEIRIASEFRADLLTLID